MHLSVGPTHVPVTWPADSSSSRRAAATSPRDPNRTARRCLHHSLGCGRWLAGGSAHLGAGGYPDAQDDESSRKLERRALPGTRSGGVEITLLYRLGPIGGGRVEITLLYQPGGRGPVHRARTSGRRRSEQDRASPVAALQRPVAKWPRSIFERRSDCLARDESRSDLQKTRRPVAPPETAPARSTLAKGVQRVTLHFTRATPVLRSTKITWERGWPFQR